MFLYAARAQGGSRGTVLCRVSSPLPPVIPEPKPAAPQQQASPMQEIISQNKNRGSLFDFDQTASLTYSSAGASKVRKPFLKNALPGNRKSR
jgi:hypothetical protein